MRFKRDDGKLPPLQWNFRGKKIKNGSNCDDNDDCSAEGICFRALRLSNNKLAAHLKLALAHPKLEGLHGVWAPSHD